MKKFLIIAIIFIVAIPIFYCGLLIYLVGNAYDWVDNLVDDVQKAEQLSALKEWAEGVMKRYREGTLKTNGPATYWARGTLKLDPNEVDKQIGQYWHKPAFNLPPETTICVSDSGAPLYVGYCWYLKGVIIAGPNYPSLDFKHFYAVEAKPGIFAYSIEK